MNEPKFTPGPWKLCPLGEGLGPRNWFEYPIQVKSGNRIIANVNIFAGNPDNSRLNSISEGTANANLIAAAPELYEACLKADQQLRELHRRLWADGHRDTPERTLLIEAIKANESSLKKARGEE